jgi:hypothetical protein
MYQTVVGLQHQVLLNVGVIDVVKTVGCHLRGSHQQFVREIDDIFVVRKGQEIFGRNFPGRKLFGGQRLGQQTFRLGWIVQVGQAAAALFDVDAVAGGENFSGKKMRI